MTQKYINSIEKLVREWDYKVNTAKGLDINNYTIGSGVKVSWRCLNGHRWNARICDRVNGNECPYCKGKKVLKGYNDLSTTNKELLEEWNYEKNSALNIFPTNVSKGSHKKVWWHCSKCDNDWEAIIYNRAVLGSGCIYCANQKAIVGVNDFKTLYPQLANEWDYEKNGDLLPENFKPKSNIKVWWRCELGHSYQSTVNHRVSGTNCPKCFSENGTSFAEQAIYYYLSKVYKVENRVNLFEKEIDIYLPERKIGFEYDGMYYHNSDKSLQKERDKDYVLKQHGIQIYHIKESDKFGIYENIIYCIPDNEYNYIVDVMKYIRQILNIDLMKVDIKKDRLNIYKQYVSIKEHSLAKEYPSLVDEWDYKNNKGLLPENFTSKSNKKVYWLCKTCNSSYVTSIFHKTEGTGCPYCVGKLVNETNNLKNKYPRLSDTWDYDKNGELKPEDVYYSSRKKVWWICPKCNKSFSASICTRIRAKEYDCSKCMHKRIGNTNRLIAVSKNKSLEILRPDLSKEWNYEKNNGLTPDRVSCGSGIKVWWKCDLGHEWQATVYNRTYGTGCPECYKLNRKCNKGEKICI